MDSKATTKELLNELSYFKIKVETPSMEKASLKYNYDKDRRVIYRSLNSLSGVGYEVTKRVIEMSKNEFGSFVDVLIYVKSDTTFKLDRSKLRSLILIGFFRKFGSELKLLRVMKEFFDGKDKWASSSKFPEKKEAVLRKKRELLIDYERSQEDSILPKFMSIRYQLEVLGMSYDTDDMEDYYLVAKVEGESTRKVYLYEISTGEEIMLKYSAKLFRERPIEEFKLLKVLEKQTKPLCYMVDGKFETDNTRFSDWLIKFDMHECSISK